MKQALLITATSLLLANCANAALRARSEVDRVRLNYARQLHVEEHAPVPYANYEKARAAADESEPESAARSDYRAEERLWLETAIADAERERLSEKRLEEERELVALDAQLVALAHEREAWAQEAELRAARALASDEARKALMRAAERPAQRVKLAREDARQAAEALLTRADLMGLTLASLDAHNDALPRLLARIGEADAMLTRDPERALSLADQAFFYALSLFAELRGRDGGPSAEEKATLAEELESAGTRASRNDRGLSGVLDHAFADFALVPVGERVLERLCQLAKAHPRGPVLLTVQGKPAQVDTRARWVRERFARAGCSGQRYTVALNKNEGEALEVTWVAY